MTHEHELLRIHFEQNFETILYNCKKNNIICEGSLSITSSIYLNDEDRMKKCDTRKEERIVRSCIITEKKKLKTGGMFCPGQNRTERRTGRLTLTSMLTSSISRELHI